MEDGISFDDLLKIKRKMEAKMDALRPKNDVDIILSTYCPIRGDDSIRVKYQGRWYLIASWITIMKVQAACEKQELQPSSFGFVSAVGIPVVENEALVKEILCFLHMSPNAYVLTDEALRWVKEERNETRIGQLDIQSTRGG